MDSVNGQAGHPSIMNGDQGIHTCSVILEKLRRWTLGSLDILGTAKLDRRSPAPWTVLRTCTFRLVPGMPLQRVLPRKPIIATIALPRRRFV